VAFIIVQPAGTVLVSLVIVESQVAEGFFTNVPIAATLLSQYCVYDVEGVVVNIAFI
jgi:hypothetical protein